MPRKTPSKKTASVDSIRHQDKRVNIPTEELRGFVEKDEQAPKTLLYPRDLSLDPQLVWKGKDEQDAQDLAVPSVPIYIQEKIHPQALINALQRKTPNGGASADLFGDFNGLEGGFADKVDFYNHDQNWANRMILGDSLYVMASLAEKEGLKGKVQAIYFDPPYGIKFGSNWQVSTRKRDVKDGKVEDATRQPEQVKAFRDTWQLGIHSYLTYLRDRLVVARELLTDTGSIFVQIGDENVHLVRSVMDEVFGSENFASQITVRKTGGLGSGGLTTVSDFIIWYAKDSSSVKFHSIYLDKETTETVEQYSSYIDPASGKYASLRKGEALPQGARLFQPTSVHTMYAGVKSCLYEFDIDGKHFKLPPNRQWSTTLPNMLRLQIAGRLSTQGNTPRFIRFLDDFPVTELNNLWADTMGSDDKLYIVQTSSRVIQRCLLMATDPGDLVLDPTCGSGTTAYVAEQWGRRWITIDTSRVALALARTRLMAAKYPYYLLADSPEGIGKETELTGITPPTFQTNNDIRRGFVYKRVPHVTLKSIANNPDIKEGMARKDIDAAIAKHADTETLYDQPYEDKKTVRVSGPFTVESLSPHRVLAAADDDMDGTVSESEAQRMQDFAGMILDNLRAAGVQNTKKNERMKLDTLETYAGTWLQARGTFTESDGKSKTVAVSIGPEHGTVGPMQVKEAAKEAVQGAGCDVLLVCGFAFDPHVSGETQKYGKLAVLAVKMNPDLSMGDELLKKTGAGNLFMVFGEPDVVIKQDKTGAYYAELKGLDVYDPTTGEVRSSSTDDIACWFIDTDYNGESFFVRHAYFTGAEEPYEKLKRALRAEIDEAAWATFYSTVSRSFLKPESGKIAVKVINHYGDEVLKVFEV